MPRRKSKGKYPPDWRDIANKFKDSVGWKCIRCEHPHDPASGHCLTVHHMDFDPSNCEWHNCLCLCQRCHLQIQAKVDPEIPWFLEHSDWLKPYISGFYALKYEGKLITREEAESRQDELLAYEFCGANK